MHALFYGAWLSLSSGIVAAVRPWDPFPFVMLAMIASVEAIFLSSFVLVSQNRMTDLADRQAELDLQINLLAEHEVTKLLDFTTAIARRLDVEVAESEEVDALRKDVPPTRILDEIDEARRVRTGDG